MPVLTEDFLSPGPKSVSTRFRQRKQCLYRSEMPFSSASRIAKYILRASVVSIPYNRRSFLGLLPTS
jgi:hypothetical protein